MTKPYIVNLASFHPSCSTTYRLNAFSQLCDEHAKGCCSRLPNFFTKISNWTWVIGKYQQLLSTAIEPYERREISTWKFLNNLLNVFYFLDKKRNDKLKFSEEVKTNLWEEKDSLMVLKNIKHRKGLNYHLIALALLERTWSEIMAFENAEAYRRFKQLLNRIVPPSEPIYFISDADEININKTLQLFRHPLDLDIQCEEKSDIVIKDNQTLIKLSNNMYLYVAPQGTKKATPALVKMLLTSPPFKDMRLEVHVISSIQEDLATASHLGVPAHHLHPAADCYFHAHKMREGDKPSHFPKQQL